MFVTYVWQTLTDKWWIKRKSCRTKYFRGAQHWFLKLRKRKFPTTWNRHQINRFLLRSPLSPLNESCQKYVSSTFPIADYGVNPCTKWDQTVFGLQSVYPGWPETRNIFTFEMNIKERASFLRRFSLSSSNYSIFNLKPFLSDMHDKV